MSNTKPIRQYGDFCPKCKTYLQSEHISTNPIINGRPIDLAWCPGCDSHLYRSYYNKIKGDNNWYLEVRR